MTITDKKVEKILRAHLDAAIGAAEGLARAERKSELRDVIVRKYDSRGVHVWSSEVGRVSELIALWQLLLPDVEPPEWDPVEARKRCRREALEAFAGELEVQREFAAVSAEAAQINQTEANDA